MQPYLWLGNIITFQGNEVHLLKTTNILKLLTKLM